jgi:ABC-type glycerol-3-phosphate transport system substrate-binding protein
MRKLFIVMMAVLLAFTGCTQAIAVTDNVDSIMVSEESNETEEVVSYATFFEEGIHEIYIDIEEEDFEDILANPTDEGFR